MNAFEEFDLAAFDASKHPGEHIHQQWNESIMVPVYCREDHPKPWGEVWGAPYIDDRLRVVVMRRKAQRVRFFTQQGEQVGPEHANVAPAMLWAIASGWVDPTDPTWLTEGMRREVASGGRVKR